MSNQRSIRAFAGALLAAGLLVAGATASADVPPGPAAQAQARGQERREAAKEKAEAAREKAAERREEAKEKAEEAREKAAERREEAGEKVEEAKEKLQERREKAQEHRKEWREKRKERREERRAEIAKRWSEARDRAPMRAELSIHAKRVAQIERIAFVAEENGNEQLAQRAKDLLEKEKARHQKRMEALSKEEKK